MYRCLYYPDFEPNHRWLRQVLLLVDEVHRILPDDVDHEDSPELQALLECCPGALKSVAPTKPAGGLPDAFMGNLERALDLCKETLPQKLSTFSLLIDPIGRIEIPGWELLHEQKVSDAVRLMLEQRNLIHTTASKYVANRNQSGSWLMVPRGVADLIISGVADQIAENQGFDAFTDRPLAFALNAVSACERGDQTLLNGTLASVIACYHIPTAIELLPVEEYAQLRENFTSARSEFSRMVLDLKGEFRLDKLRDPQILRRRMDEVCLAIGETVERAQASHIASTIGNWSSFFLSTALPVATGVITNSFQAGLATGAATFGINLLSKLTNRPVDWRYPKVYRLLASAKQKSGQAEINALH